MAGVIDIPARPRLLVSACLLGDPVRYDGNSKPLHHAGLEKLRAEGRLVAFCPETAGGLPVPRAPAEIVGGDGDAVLAGMARVETRLGDDVSDHFRSGAEQALQACRLHGIRTALLTERSPSCGSREIYDGSFSRQTIEAGGVTAALLRQQGIEVFNQHQVEAALDYLSLVSGSEEQHLPTEQSRG